MCFVWLRWLVPRIIGTFSMSSTAINIFLPRLRLAVHPCRPSLSPQRPRHTARCTTTPGILISKSLSLSVSRTRNLSPFLSAFDSALIHTLAALGLLHNVSSKTSSTPLQPIFLRRLGPHSIPSTREIISCSYSTYVLNNTPPLQTRFVFCS